MTKSKRKRISLSHCVTLKKNIVILSPTFLDLVVCFVFVLLSFFVPFVLRNLYSGTHRTYLLFKAHEYRPWVPQVFIAY